ncbi:hypothetical protein, partial [Iamia sp.]|uniref:hypothetical protein n=1 Tax=Iamia sp. TaxID=2722710 RepID=UPI002C76641C
MSLPLPAALTPPTTPRTAEAVAEVMDLAAEHAALNPVKAKMLRHEVRLLTTGKQRWMATVAHPA